MFLKPSVVQKESLPDEFEATNTRLYAKIGRLTVDLEWLKKSGISL